jgi:hypothetical protein
VALGKTFKGHRVAVEFCGAIAGTSGPKRPACTGQSPVTTRIRKRGWA